MLASPRQYCVLVVIDDTPGINLQYLEMRIRALVKSHGIKVIIIDYLQLITLSKSDTYGKSREQEVSYLSKSLKLLAKKYKVVMIVLSQLSRAVETRNPPKPILSDLRESGGIEQDADTVMFLYRPEYYNIFTDEAGNNIRGLAQIIIAKNRFGPLKNATVQFIGKYTKFRDLPENEYEDNEIEFPEEEMDIETPSF